MSPLFSAHGNRGNGRHDVTHDFKGDGAGWLGQVDKDHWQQTGAGALPRSPAAAGDADGPKRPVEDLVAVVVACVAGPELKGATWRS